MPSFHFSDHGITSVCDVDGRDTLRSRQAILPVAIKGGLVAAVECRGWIEFGHIEGMPRVRICNISAWSVKCSSGQIGTEFTAPGTQVLGVMAPDGLRVVHSTGWPIILPQRPVQQTASLELLMANQDGKDFAAF